MVTANLGRSIKPELGNSILFLSPRMELKHLRKTIYQLNDLTKSSTISSIIDSLDKLNRDSTVRYQLTETLALKRPNSVTLRKYLDLTYSRNSSSKALRMYEIQKDSISLETLREYALFACKINDPIYLAAMINHANSKVIDPLLVSDGSIKTFRAVLGIKSVLLCLFLNVQAIPILCLLGINASLLYFVRPFNKESIHAFNELQRSVFFHSKSAWAPRTVINYFVALKTIELSKNSRLEYLDPSSSIDRQVNSSVVQQDYLDNQFTKIVDKYESSSSSYSLSALGTVIDSYFKVRKPLEALKLYEENRKYIFNASIHHKRFILNSLIKTLGFLGVVHYAEFIYLHEFNRLNVTRSNKSLMKLVQSFTYTNEPVYNQFWDELRSSDSSTYKDVARIFNSSFNDISNVLANRNEILKKSNKAKLNNQVAKAFSYFITIPPDLNDPVPFEIMMEECKSLYASIRLFAVFHQWSEQADNKFNDPFSNKSMNFGFEIYDEIKSDKVYDFDLFGHLPITRRGKNNPPTMQMFRLLKRSLQKLNLLSPELDHQIYLRSKKVNPFKNFKYK